AGAELVRADPQPVAAGLAGHGHQVLAGGERGDQLVDGGARQLQLAHDVGGGERPVPVEEELEDVQSPGHGWYEASHGRSPSLCVSGARCRSRRRVAGGAVPGAFDISTGDRNGEHRLTIRTSTGNGTGVPDGRRERRTSRPGGAVRGRAYGPGSTRRWSAAHAGVPQFAPQPLGAQDEFQLEAAVRVVYLVAP